MDSKKHGVLGKKIRRKKGPAKVPPHGKAPLG
jgi:hypothetical protein